MSFQDILSAILKDALLGGALAAEVFVKNPTHQAEAARMLSAANTLIQTISEQLSGQSQQTQNITTAQQ